MPHISIFGKNNIEIDIKKSGSSILMIFQSIQDLITWKHLHIIKQIVTEDSAEKSLVL